MDIVKQSTGRQTRDKTEENLIKEKNLLIVPKDCVATFRHALYLPENITIVLS